MVLGFSAFLRIWHQYTQLNGEASSVAKIFVLWSSPISSAPTLCINLKKLTSVLQPPNRLMSLHELWTNVLDKCVNIIVKTSSVYYTIHCLFLSNLEPAVYKT